MAKQKKLDLEKIRAKEREYLQSGGLIVPWYVPENDAIKAYIRRWYGKKSETEGENL